MIVSATSLTGEDVEAVRMPDGTIRRLGYTPSGRGLYAAPRFQDKIKLMDRKDWQPFNQRRTAVPVLNQGQVGSCVCHGATRSLMLARDAMGQSPLLLSSSFLYALINHGRDQGSDPSDAMTKLQTTGVCLDSQLPEGFYTQNKLSTPMFDTAMRFRVIETEFYSGETFDELGSALQFGYFAFYTLKVAGDWNQFDANGCPPARRGMGNHCMSGGEGYTILKDGRPGIPTAQSWGIDWGDQGYCNLSEDHFAEQPGLQILILRLVVVDPQDPLAAWLVPQ